MFAGLACGCAQQKKDMSAMMHPERPKQLDMLEESLASSPFVLGDAPSLADFALYGSLRPLEIAGEEIPRQFPKLRAWYPRAATV